MDMKCSLKKHEDNNAVHYCLDCKIYMCNKCDNFHSELFPSHNKYKLNKDFNINGIFSGYCKEENHNNPLIFICKTHNLLCCAACLSKIKKKGNGQHSDCQVCLIEEVKEEKRNKLKDNINILEKLSNNFESSLNKLKSLSETINENKEGIKMSIQKVFTNIRTALNDREDKLLSQVDEIYNDIFIKDEIIKESIKLPNKIKGFLEKAKIIDKDWNNEDKLLLCINECINIENSINCINEINDKINKSQNYKETNINFSYDNKFINIIETFGKINYKNNLKEYLNDSLILEENKNYIENLKNWINKEKEFKTQLLYRKTRDGDSYDSFHKKCDNQGATLVIIKTTDKNIIGGYSPLEWDDHSGWKSDKETFLFSLTDNKIFRKTKKSDSIFCHKDAGTWFPYFGFYKYNGRMNLTQGQILGKSYSDFDNYNFLLSNNGKTKNFDAEEVEVYKIIFD